MAVTARSPKVPNKRGSPRKTTRNGNKGPALGGDQFQLRSFYDAQGRLAPERVAQALRMSKSQLAETIGVNREALYKPERAQAPKTQTRVREMVEIVERAGRGLGRRPGSGDRLVSRAAYTGLWRANG